MDRFMQRAYELAQKGVGFTSPNPTVGAVLVKKGNIIGEGYHKKAGKLHAEIIAIKDAKKKKHDVSGSKLYVTLEPCVHTGKTPPCTEAIHEAGIKKVVIGMKDPSKKVDGKGARLLACAGIKVEWLSRVNELYKDIRLLNQPFIKHATIGLPYVTIKVGMSLDGKIATRTMQSKWITKKRARSDARMIRSQHDAVLVGSGTVKADDPQLAAHGRWKNKNLLRVIIDPTGSCPQSSRVFRDDHVLVVSSGGSFGKKRVSIKKLLRYLGNKNYQSVFVEGGSGVHGSFFDAFLRDRSVIDRVITYISPRVIGGKGISFVGGQGVADLSKSVVLDDVMTEQIGDDIKVSGYYNIY